MQKILIVDDEAPVCDFLVHVFQSRGFVPIVATNGIEALAVARAERPDVVIADIIMPVVDGFEFVRMLRNDPMIAATPVIFHTGGYRRDEASALAQACGVTELISKPAEVDAICEAVRRALLRPCDTQTQPLPEEFDRDHLRLVTDRLSQDVRELRTANARLADLVKDSRRSERKLRESAERLETLSRELLQAQERERRHIARELHDEIGQALTAVKINLLTLMRQTVASSEPAALGECVEMVERALTQVRGLSLDLRPAMLDDLGLVPAVRWYLERVSRHANLPIELTTGPFYALLSPEVETGCFRIIQEAITNVVRHARCRRAWVKLRMDDVGLHLIVRDDGVGFEVAEARAKALNGGSLGLLGMEERSSLLGGRLQIRSSPGRGCEIHGRFPNHMRCDRAGTLFAPHRFERLDGLRERPSSPRAADSLAGGVLP